MNQLEYLPVVFSELLIYKVPMHFLCKYIILKPQVFYLDIASTNYFTNEEIAL